MKHTHDIRRFPRSRIATIDTFAVGLGKHHVSALLEFDVTDIRKRLQELRRKGVRVSFNAWLIKAVSNVLVQHPEAGAFLKGNRKLVMFKDVNISIVVEKSVGGEKVPIPLLIEKTNEKSAEEINAQIEKAKHQTVSGKDIVLQKKPSFFEKFYYHLPGFLRRGIWRMMLNSPEFTHKKMGNVIITSVGMMGVLKGWFIHRSVHPISFGVGSVLKKAVVIENEVKIREILNMTILVDHDLIDGAPMVRFLHDLTRQIEK